MYHQGMGSLGTDLNIPEYFNFSTRSIKFIYFQICKELQREWKNNTESFIQ